MGVLVAHHLHELSWMERQYLLVLARRLEAQQMISRRGQERLVQFMKRVTKS